MNDIQQIDEKFLRNCFRLEREDIVKLDKEDNGSINNVMAGISDHCYGVKLYDDTLGLSAEMFYINGKQELRGDIIRININDPDYFLLLLRFCCLLAHDYEIDAINAFNTFQQRLRSFLEKRDFFTVTNLELKRFKGQNGLMMSFAHRGIIKIDLIRHEEFYKDFFNNIVNQPIEKGRGYVYLMVNSETGLIKIGRSVNPGYREGTLHSKEPSVHLIAFWCCEPKIETMLHSEFKHKRERGEWFRLNIEDLKKLEAIMINIEKK